MANTTVNLGMLPQNRGEYSSSATYYKDNIVQYNGSSYICTATMDLEHPSGITGVAPYNSDPATPNTGWAVFSNDSSGVGEGVYNVSVDHTTDNQPKVYASLSAALNDIPAAKQKGGMEIRFIFNNSDYVVDKEEGLTTQPAGTLITSSPTMVDGTYKAAQLLGYFSTLPTATGDSNAVVYYNEVDGTYTTWTITLHTFDNKYVQYRLMADSWSINTDDWAIADESVYVENPEFVYVKTDAEGKILWAIRTDGDIFYGAGVPSQVQEKLDNKAEVTEVADLAENKVDKEEGKSLIDEEYASTKSTIESPEFIGVTLDAEDKVLEGIQQDGTKVIGGDLNVGGSSNIEDNIRVLGDMEVSGVSYKVIENPEYLAAWVDSEGKVLLGLKADGKTYVGDADFLKDIKDNQKAIAEIKTTLATIGAKVDFLDIDALSSIIAVENPEFIEAKTDSEGKLLAGRTPEGKAFENVGFSTTNLEVAGIDITDNAEAIDCNTAIEDIEGRSEITTDAEGKIISYRDSKGMKHEFVGIETNDITLPKNTLEQSYQYNKKHIELKNWYHPNYGKVVIKEETFYLTANPSYSTKNDVVCIQVRDSTAGTEPASYYYIKSTLTPLPGGGYDSTSINEDSVRLDFYIAKDCTEVDGRYYVKSTLVDGQVVPESIEVIQIKDVPPYKAWAVNKDKHYCVADVDFGFFYNKTNVPIELSYQGNSTMVVNKKGFRLTFYKKNDYKKKDKVKLGEWLRLSGYNLKSYVTDSSRLKSAINYALIYEIWTSRGKDDFPWNNKNNVYNGATGCIEEFPIETWFGDEFFGLQFFGIKKDEKNYLLDGDDDSSGIFVNGDFNNQTTWINANASHWSDELGVEGRELAYPQKGDDSVSVETANAMNEFFKYTKGFITGEIEIEGETVPFENSMLEERIDLASWIDYWIGLQVFLLWDNIYGNIVLYSGRDKKVFYPFFYDVDQSLTTVMGPYVDLTDLCQDPTHHPASVPTDVSFWVKFKDEYKDNIINRYTELRKTILSNKNIENIYQTIISEIPESVNNAEKQKWGGDINNYSNVLKFLELRLEWLDNSQFNL